MKFLFRKIAPKYFITSQLAILVAGLFFLFGIHYIVNIQYQPKAKPFANGPVTTQPKSFTLDLTEPADNSLVFTPQILISGETTQIGQIILVTNNNEQVIKSTPEGDFSQSIDLTEGANYIRVIVFDDGGDLLEEQRTVYYSKEKLE